MAPHPGSRYVFDVHCAMCTTLQLILIGKASPLVLATCALVASLSHRRSPDQRRRLQLCRGDVAGTGSIVVIIIVIIVIILVIVIIIIKTTHASSHGPHVARTHLPSPNFIKNRSLPLDRMSPPALAPAISVNFCMRLGPAAGCCPCCCCCCCCCWGFVD